MSTIYKNLTDSQVERFVDHDIYRKGLLEVGDRVELVDIEFHNGCDIEDVVEVIVGDNDTYIVVDNTDFKEFLIFKMSTAQFKSDYAEKVWAKFRAEHNDTICPECGEKMAHMVAGKNLPDMRIEQFYCDGCGYGWIGHPSGKFIREGVLHSEWDVQ